MTATGDVGALESVIDEAHRRAERRRALWGGALFAALGLALILFFTVGNGGAGSGKPTLGTSAPGRHGSESPAVRHLPFKPIFFFGGIRKPPGGARLKQKHQLVALPTPVGTAAIWTAPDWAVRGTCTWLTVRHAVYGGECRRSQPPRFGLSALAPVSLPIRGQILNVLWGHVGGDVTSLRLRFQDGTVHTLPLTRGVFFYVLPRQRRLVGHRPTRLIALERTGRGVSKQLRFTFTR